MSKATHTILADASGFQFDIIYHVDQNAGGTMIEQQPDLAALVTRSMSKAARTILANASGFQLRVEALTAQAKSRQPNFR